MTPILGSAISRGREVAITAAIALAATCAFAPVGLAADAAIVIDGSLEDMAGFAKAIQADAPGDAIIEDDAIGDVRVFDAAVVAGRPITDFYFANGFDQTFDVLAYDRSARTLYLGLRVAGAIGDTDGDGNPDANADDATVGDVQGIGYDDLYAWTIRTAGSPAGRGAIRIEVAKNEVSVHGAGVLESAFAFRGSELEVIVRGIDLPATFEARVAVSNAGDGLGEDTHALGAGPEPAVAAFSADEALARGDEAPVRANGGGVAAPAASGADAAQAGAPAPIDASGAIATDAAVAGGLMPAAVESASDGIAVLGRAYPNPFAASVTFGYEVKGAGQSVDVGVFDVTGRQVARLASGPQGPGRASVRWDGKDDGGVRMAPGVYFLKASIGGVERVQRLVRIDG